MGGCSFYAGVGARSCLPPHSATTAVQPLLRGVVEQAPRFTPGGERGSLPSRIQARVPERVGPGSFLCGFLCRNGNSRHGQGDQLSVRRRLYYSTGVYVPCAGLCKSNPLQPGNKYGGALMSPPVLRSATVPQTYHCRPDLSSLLDASASRKALWSSTSSTFSSFPRSLEVSAHVHRSFTPWCGGAGLSFCL